MLRQGNKVICYFCARKEGILALPKEGPKKRSRKRRAGPGRGHKGPISNLRLSTMQMNIYHEQIKTEPVPIPDENNAEMRSNNLLLSIVEHATKMENHESFSLSDETIRRALKELAEKMKLLFMFHNPT